MTISIQVATERNNGKAVVVPYVELRGDKDYAFMKSSDAYRFHATFDSLLELLSNYYSEASPENKS